MKDKFLIKIKLMDQKTSEIVVQEVVYTAEHLVQFLSVLEERNEMIKHNYVDEKLIISVVYMEKELFRWNEEEERAIR